MATVAPEPGSPAAAAGDPAAPGDGRSLVFDAIGTRWRIDADVALDDVAPAVHALIDAYDRTWSRFRPDSVVAEMARRPGRYVLGPEAGPLLGLLRALHDATDGAVTPLVGAALEHHGYDAAVSLRPAPGPAAAVPGWDATMRPDRGALVLLRPALLDVGAAGKGQLVDLVSALLTARGVARHVVDAGGDMRSTGPEPLRVALEHPADPTQAIGVVELGAGAICASAVNRRAWGIDRHHVLDGRTGEPTREVVATWALAPTAMEADGLATALFFASPGALRRRFAFSGVRLFADGVAERTPDLPGELFT